MGKRKEKQRLRLPHRKRRAGVAALSPGSCEQTPSTSGCQNVTTARPRLRLPLYPLWARPAPFSQALLVVKRFSIARPFKGHLDQTTSQWIYKRCRFPSPLPRRTPPSLRTGKQLAHACPGLGLPRFRLAQLPYAKQGIKKETKHTRGTLACTHTHSSRHWSE